MKTTENYTKPFEDDWTPIEQTARVAIRSTTTFGDDSVRYGRVVGWHVGKKSNIERRDPFKVSSEPQLEYQVVLLKNQSVHWVPAEDITGFVQGV